MREREREREREKSPAGDRIKRALGITRSSVSGQASVNTCHHPSSEVGNVCKQCVARRHYIVQLAHASRHYQYFSDTLDVNLEAIFPEFLRSCTSLEYIRMCNYKR